MKAYGTKLLALVPLAAAVLLLLASCTAGGGGGQPQPYFEAVVIQGTLSVHFVLHLLETQQLIDAHWWFGDGTDELTDHETIDHTYIKPGTYDVTVIARVIENAGGGGPAHPGTYGGTLELELDTKELVLALKVTVPPVKPVTLDGIDYTVLIPPPWWDPTEDCVPEQVPIKFMAIWNDWIEEDDIHPVRFTWEAIRLSRAERVWTAEGESVTWPGGYSGTSCHHYGTEKYLIRCYMYVSDGSYQEKHLELTVCAASH